MKFLSPEAFKDYELIDCGNYRKLEKFGSFILDRPEPQAVWDTDLNENEWQKLSHASFSRDAKNPEKGTWKLKPTMKEQWMINYDPLKLTFRLGLTSFKHVGIFPEQAPNWDFIHRTLGTFEEKAKVLNLFAYTGGASLAAKRAGADVTHVDSVKQVISWSRENMEASNLDQIRWMVEDAMKFVQREVRRGNKYNGIILDPPAYGRGPNNEKWIIEDMLNDLLKNCAQLMADKNSFIILNLYAIGFSPLIVETLINANFGKPSAIEIGELFVQDQFDKKLPLSIYGRFVR